MKSIIIVCILPFLCSAQKYPVTASWFKDRFSLKEWNDTFLNFTKIGGDTVLMRAPPVVAVTKDTLDNDPDFASCVTSGGVRCSTDAINEMSQLGLSISSLAAYKYEENFSDDIMKCQKYDKKIVNSKTYYRIVLSAVNVSDPCNLPNGTEVLVLFTSFSGIDPHELLLESAAANNMSVYFGLPGALTVDSKIYKPMLYPYSSWTQRVISDQLKRYAEISSNYENHHLTKPTTPFSAFKGYYSTDQCSLADVNNSVYLEVYNIIRSVTTGYNKQLAISTNIDLRKTSYSSVDDHMKLFQAIVNASRADVVIVQEGRGSGNAGYYWATQNTSPISKVDQKLYNILRGLDPNLPETATFDDVYVGSIQQVFGALVQSKDNLSEAGIHFDMWLGIDAYENLKDDVCSPADRSGSGNTRLVDKTTKSRIDRALTAAGAVVQKVAAFAWDPDFTCRTNHSANSLADEILFDAERPIISKCFFHSSFNRSVVVIGYNLLRVTPGYTVDWIDIGNRLHSSSVHGYYFEMDYGSEHHFVPSLIYTQLYDPYDVMQLKPKGHVIVKAGGSYHSCAFTYDFTNENQ